MAQSFLYQVINHTRQEILYGTTDLALDKEVERLSKDPKCPASAWQRGDAVGWRPLTDWMDEAIVRNLHQSIEARTPPNKFKVLKTYAPKQG
ncbi:MAG: hypothetical protein U1E65_24215 [Myxococcota bacterium]